METSTATNPVLLQIPDELLQIICNNLFPDAGLSPDHLGSTWNTQYKSALRDISSLGQACKKLNDFCQPVLYRFIKVSTVYANNPQSYGEPAGSGVSGLRLLKALAINPSLGYHIDHLEFEEALHQGSTDPIMNYDAYLWLESMLQQRSIQLCDLLSSIGDMAVIWGRHSFLVCLLLYLSPRVYRVSIDLGDIPRWGKYNFGRPFKAPGERVELLPRTRPSVVQTTSKHSLTSLAHLEKFVNLSGVNELNLSSPSDSFSPRTVLPLLKQVRLYRGHISKDGIRSIIRSAEQLEHFQLFETHFLHPRSATIRDVLELLQPHGGSLKTLHLSLERQSTTTTSLDGLPELRKLVIDALSFFQDMHFYPLNWWDSKKTFQSLSSIVKGLPKLEHLQLISIHGGFSSQDFALLAYVADDMPSLEYIGLSFSPEWLHRYGTPVLSDGSSHKSLDDLAAECRRL
ncbi:hypothetical protein QBC43DRAFT_338186 [Cladorrhinum sp. PSN259]|nr:hypothetical protein QBC43DRAFT_338186 [Cladorrhinum sp. PSN259]